MSEPNAERARKLETLLGELLAASPRKSHLIEVVWLVPELREKAWQAYCDTQPTKNDLLSLIEGRQWRSIVRYPALLLIERYGDRDTLLHLMEDEAEVREKAARKLLAGDCEQRTLSAVLKRMSDNVEMRTQAADKLLELLEQPETEDTLPQTEKALCDILAYAPEGAKAAGERLLKRKIVSEQAQQLICAYAPSLVPELMKRYKDTMSEYTLGAIMMASQECAGEAARMLLLLQKGNVFYALFEVFRYYPPLREQAWQKLSVLSLSQNQAAEIGRVAPEYKERAMALVPVASRTVDTILGEIFSAQRLS